MSPLLRGAVALLLTLVLVQSQHLGLFEGDSCGDLPNWKCRRADNCSAIGDVRVSRPLICSFQDRTPVICCPPKPISNVNKAITKCQNYTSTSCSGSSVLSRSALALDLDSTFSIVGGALSRPRSHKHMTLIGYGPKESPDWQCGGSIISPNFILSAAHCATSPQKLPARWVRAGDLDISTTLDDASPQVVEISKRIVHPNYSTSSHYNDIALFKLVTNLVFNDWVAPACLAAKPLLPETKATATGWGRTDFAGDVSPHLLEVDLTLVKGTECKRLLGTTPKMTRGVDPETMICAGEKEGGKDTCSGDSGGPLVVNTQGSCLKTQIGIVSFGKLCALPNSPGVYTRVYHYLPWIQSVVWP